MGGSGGGEVRVMHVVVRRGGVALWRQGGPWMPMRAVAWTEGMASRRSEMRGFDGGGYA